MLKCVRKNVPQGIGFYYFKHLKQLNLVNCLNLKHIFCASMASSLVGLQAVTISFCKKLQQVVGGTVGEEEEGGGSALSDDKITLPQLNSLHLSDLCDPESFFPEHTKFEGTVTKNRPSSTSYSLFNELVNIFSYLVLSSLLGISSFFPLGCWLYYSFCNFLG